MNRKRNTSMTKEELITLCLNGKKACADTPFGANGATAVRHTQNGKWFALIFVLEGKLCVNLKCQPVKADFWRSVYHGVQPAWHMNKTHWNKVEMDTDVLPCDLQEMINDSYALTK
ncbi:MAG: MmcQ/YjbR family DNA-binding protein [Oscillospiraceae bacterium]|nr:MmcQ/YjbR family DNA-binding protein [Oscillospiraceae bacterium]